MRGLLLWLCLAGLSAGQGDLTTSHGVLQSPPRDPRALDTTGTGSIGGRVRAADTGLPLRRALVTLGGARRGLGTYTDGDGRYEFAGLPSGTYTIFVNPGPQRAGYQPASYGSAPTTSGIGVRARSIELADGQRLENIDVALLPTGVITGRVTDAAGQPVARLQVAALSLRGSEPMMAGSASSDDLGEFRIFNLSPGDYIVRVNPGSGFSGAMELVGEVVGYAQTYAPGTASPADAARFRVGRGTQAHAEVRLVETSLYRVSGLVVTSTGDPGAGGSVTVARPDTLDGSNFNAGVMSPSGTFSVRGVPPGSYQVVARFQPPRQPGAVFVPGESGQEYGTALIDVISGDVENVVITTRPGATVAGSLVFDEALPSGGRANLSALPVERRNYMGTPVVQVTGSAFTLRELFGPVVIRGNASGGPASWGLKAVLLRGKDITDVPTVLTAADSGHLEVVFTAKAPSLEGFVADDTGAPVPDAVVLLFGHDPDTWRPRSSFQHAVRPGRDGTFMLRGLREGQYWVAAVPPDVITNPTQPSPEFLRGLRDVATALTLNDGETRTLDLRLLRFEER